jgi:hypothetical protein
MHIFSPCPFATYEQKTSREENSHFPETIHWHIRRLCARTDLFKSKAQWQYEQHYTKTTQIPQNIIHTYSTMVQIWIKITIYGWCMFYHLINQLLICLICFIRLKDLQLHNSAVFSSYKQSTWVILMNQPFQNRIINLYGTEILSIQFFFKYRWSL